MSDDTIMTASGSEWFPPLEVPEGDWAAKRRLATQLKRLITLCVATDAPAEALDAAAALVEQGIACLETFPTRTFREGMLDGDAMRNRIKYGDRNALLGRCNPIAPPLEVRLEGGVIHGRLTFTTEYEGPPGFVHGGMVAAAYDQLLGFLQVNRGVPSMTGSLTIRYSRPTPINIPLRLEGTIQRVEGRRSHLEARMYAGEQQLSRAEGIFIALNAELSESLFGR